ncbi:hypothetical protein O152_gp107 [Pseudomonas phage PaBG]|uniref:Uncharacterized protein n=1 Tax=Pseudomonas phage PaBG TaxID=1335230 RepID=S5VV59_9CAUD|nr:hypothetical protein O152_gp107 [Pseudomonas phage PaBG]AGS81992.1 hypothetical protein PaBG_00107 [Pseudomonas phage PaBG]
MIDISRYKWFLYQGRDVVLVTDHPEFDLQLVKEAKFGYRKIGANHYVVARSDLDVRFKIKEKDAKRIINNSRGWKGKIRSVPVEAGTGGLDAPVKSSKGKRTPSNVPDKNDPNLYVLQIDSSNLARAWLDKKAKELHVVFHSDVHWVYEDVSLKLAKQLEAAESQGRFFIYRIREVKKQYKVSD